MLLVPVSTFQQQHSPLPVGFAVIQLRQLLARVSATLQVILTLFLVVLVCHAISSVLLLQLTWLTKLVLPLDASTLKDALPLFLQLRAPPASGVHAPIFLLLHAIFPLLSHALSLSPVALPTPLLFVAIFRTQLFG